MKNFAALLLLPAAVLPASAQIKFILPPDPVAEAKIARAGELIEQARPLARRNEDQQAIAILRRAADIEATIRAGFWSRAKYALARIYVKQNRIDDALANFKAVFAWNPKSLLGGIKRGDLDGGSVQAAIEYAILLAQAGRPGDAKALYYYGLRAYLNQELPRDMEPAPFLVVFDLEPEGICWDYSPRRLEAAAMMLSGMLTGGTTDFATGVVTSSRDNIAKARELAPEWFYPVLFLANQANYGSERQQDLLSQAGALVKPGIERQLLDQYRRDLADWRAICDEHGWAQAVDGRPLAEGARRRSQMQCLRPDEQVLRRLSVAMPGD